MKNDRRKQTLFTPGRLLRILLAALLAAALICALGAFLIAGERIGADSAGALSVLAACFGVFAGCVCAGAGGEEKRGVHVLQAGGLLTGVCAVFSACCGGLLTAGALRALLGCLAGCVLALLLTPRRRQSKLRRRRIYKT